MRAQIIRLASVACPCAKGPHVEHKLLAWSWKVASWAVNLRFLLTEAWATASCSCCSCSNFRANSSARHLHFALKKADENLPRNKQPAPPSVGSIAPAPLFFFSANTSHAQRWFPLPDLDACYG
eukprot:2201185-Amphidinium_carterae.1